MDYVRFERKKRYKSSPVYYKLKVTATNIYSRHVQHELYNRSSMSEKGKRDAHLKPPQVK